MTGISLVKQFFYAVSIFSFFLLVASYSLAEQKLLAPDRLSSNAQGKLEFFKSKPVHEYMSRDEFTGYDKALSAQDCKLAGRILTNAFFRTYTQFKPTKTRYDCAPEEYRDCVHWEFYVMATFKGYALCTLNEALRDLEKKLRQSTETLPRYSMPRFPKKKHYDNDDVRGRDEALAGIIAQADGGHIRSLDKVAALIRQGEVFSAGSDVEYYVLRLACIQSNNCRKWQVRLAGLKTELGAKRSEHIDAIVKKSTLQQPRLNDLILGKSF